MSMMKRAVERCRELFAEVEGEALNTFSVDHAMSQAMLLSHIEGLLEHLEIEDCGSVGGFGYGFTKAGYTNSIRDRIDYLYTKYVVMNPELLEAYK